MSTQDLTNAIAEAIYLAQDAEVKRLLNEHPEQLHGRDGFLPWLLIAARMENVALVKWLLDRGCDVNAEEATGNRLTALNSAVVFKDTTLARVLLERGVNPNQGRQLICAITEGSLEMVELLVRYSADIHRVFENELTHTPMNALSTAIDWGYDHIADYLRARGAVLPTALPRKPEGPKQVQELPAEAVPLKDQILTYFTEQFGPVWKQALMEIVPTEPSITIHVIPPTTKRNHVTLFTVGMSAQPMTVPPGGKDFQYAELFVQLPANWPYKQLNDPQHTWPMRWLRSTAQYPFHEGTWLGGRYAIVANDDPPKPLAPQLPFTCFLFLAEQSLVARDGRKIQLYRMMPLYTEERNLEIRKGIDALLTALEKQGIALVADPKRRNVAAIPS
jgi:hypothetical protein